MGATLQRSIDARTAAAKTLFFTMQPTLQFVRGIRQGL